MKFAVPVSGTSKIEMRLRSILDPKQKRSAVTKKLLAVIALIGFATVVPLAAAKAEEPQLPTFTELKAGADNPLPPLPDTPNKTLGRVVTGFKFSGNTVITSDDLQKVLVSQKGVGLDRQKVDRDMLVIQKAYGDKGFAVLVQSVSQQDDGTLSFELLETKLTQIKLDRLDKVDPQTVRKLIATPVNKPFDVNSIHRDLDSLYKTNLFDNVKYRVDDDPNVKGGVVMTFVFKEKNAGK